MDYGLIVDLETTGLNPKTDKIIEIGIILFAVTENGKPAIQTMYSALEDPGEGLSPEIVGLTGITDEMLAGQTIDWTQVNALFAKASIAIAHNAPFDRGFLMQHPAFEARDTHWACSVQHIDWASKGFKSRSLTYLAADHGFVNPFAHRALFDCATTYRVASAHLAELIEKSYQKLFLIQAFGARFEVKDLLKKRGYRWNGGEKVWQKTVFEDQLKNERDYLSENIYGGPPAHSETLTTLDDGM